MTDRGILEEVKRLKSLAEIGLLYSNNEYDRERYLELQDISFRLFNKISGHDIELINEVFPLVKDYPTVKVEIRGLLLSAKKKL